MRRHDDVFLYLPRRRTRRQPAACGFVPRTSTSLGRLRPGLCCIASARHAGRRQRSLTRVPARLLAGYSGARDSVLSARPTPTHGKVAPLKLVRASDESCPEVRWRVCVGEFARLHLWFARLHLWHWLFQGSSKACPSLERPGLLGAAQPGWRRWRVEG